MPSPQLSLPPHARGLLAHPRATRPAPFAQGLIAASLLCGALASQAAGNAPAAAQAAAAPTIRYAIEGGSLAAVLSRFAAASGIALSFDPSATLGMKSDGLRGDLTVRAGFARLLAGSGLEAVDNGNGEFTLRTMAQNTAPGAATLQTVQVTASGLRAPVEADNSYRPTPSASTLRSALPVLEVPQVVNVVPAQAIRDQRPRNLDDALANVSGITQGNTLASTQDTIMKRGFGGNRDGSIMHNGMPLVQGRGMNAAAESVEVVKGPSSLLYGIMDPGGVVNVVSKRPQLVQHTSVSALASGYAGGRNGGGLTLDTTGPIGEDGLAYRLVVDRVSEDYWRNFGSHRETLVAPSVAWYGDQTQAVLSYEYRSYLTPFDRGTALDPRTQRPLDIPATRRLDEPFNAMRGESHLAQLSVDHQLASDWKAHLGLSYNRETYDANQLRVNGVNPTAGTLARSNDATHGALSTDSYAIGYLDGKLTLGGLRHDLQAGADLEYRRIYRADLLRQASRSTFSYLNPVYGREQPSATVSASDSDQTDSLHNQSLFLQDAIHLGDRWIAVAGLRWQGYRQIAGRGRPFVTNTKTDDHQWLPRLGLVYQVDAATSLYASYTQSLKPASTIAPLSSGVVITSAMEPEKARSWEIGAKYDVPGTLAATLAFFNIEKKNVLVSQFNDVTKLTDWRTSGAARSRGMELDVSGQFNAQWSAIGSLAYIDARTTEDPLYAGNRLWNVARHTASLFGVYTTAGPDGQGRVRLGAGARYVGRRAGDSANSFELPSYTVADAFAAYDTRIGGQRVKFQLNVKNLLNKVYYTSSVNSYFISMGDARQISLLTTFDF